MLLDRGRVVDTGTEAELTERSPLFRALLGGSGDDLEAAAPTDELAAAADRADRVRRRVVRDPSAQVGRRARRRCGRYDRLVGTSTPVPVAAGARGPVASRRAWVGGRRRWRAAVRPMGVGGGPIGGAMAALPATPELLATVAALPPATRSPAVDLAPQASRPTRGSVCGTLLRPLRGLLALAPAAGGARRRRLAGAPAADAPRGRRRSRARGHRAVCAAALRRAARRRGRLARADRADRRHRPHRRAAAVHAAAQDLRAAAAAGPGLLRARAGRPDHDPDDDRRRCALVIPADRTRHRHRLAAAVRRRLRRAARAGREALARRSSR